MQYGEESCIVDGTSTNGMQLQWSPRAPRSNGSRRGHHDCPRADWPMPVPLGIWTFPLLVRGYARLVCYARDYAFHITRYDISAMTRCVCVGSSY
jgi:hypothetical protein